MPETNAGKKLAQDEVAAARRDDELLDRVVGLVRSTGPASGATRGPSCGAVRR